ncbi:MAG: AAA family ATPase [Candidatus Eremiobacteraeota bacterium]|nr:AAA family ATPase [Candidatus Eremiobacteraeota bacterium]
MQVVEETPQFLRPARARECADANETATPRMVSERVVSRSFIGRLIELEHLVARRRAAAEGRGGAVLVAGEAGIGKSRLLGEYRSRYAGAAAGSIVAAACRPFAQRPLSPIADVLSQLTGARFTLHDDTKRSKEELLDAIVSAFGAAAARRTRTVVIEDLHWADVELVQVLTALAEHAAHRRLLFIATYRENEIVPTSANFTSFGRLVRVPAVSLVRLEALSAPEVSELLSGMLAYVDVEVPPSMLEDVRRKSAGNPLFAEELMRHAVDSQRSGAVVPASLPISLHGVIRERLDRCTTAQRELLSQASLFGRRFSLDLLCDVFTRDRERAFPLLKELRELQLIETSEGDADAYQFRHALTRDAVYAELLPAEARRLHQELAETIAARPDASEHIELLAHSFWEAQLFSQAAPYCEAAANAARDVHAHEDALLWYERAARAYGDDSMAAARVLEMAATAAVRLDDTKRSAALHERAIDLCEAAGQYDEAARMCRGLAGTYFNDGSSDRALAVFDKAREFAERGGDARVRNGVLVRLFSAYAGLRRLSEAQRCAGQIDERTLAENRVDTVVFSLTRSSVHAQLGDLEAWRADFQRGLDALPSDQNFQWLARYAHGTITRQALELGEMDVAREQMRLGSDVARHIRADESHMRMFETEIDLRTGRLPRVPQNLRSMAVAREFITRHKVAAMAVTAGYYLGDDDLVASSLDISLIDEAEAKGNTFALAILCAPFSRGLRQLGREEDAEVLLRRAMETISVRFGMTHEIAIVVTGRPEYASTLTARLEKPGMPSKVDVGLTSLIDACIAKGRHDAPTAQRLAREAASRFGAIGWPLLQAECLEVAEETAAALEIYRAAGAFGCMRRLERTALSSRTAKDRGILTPREREVAQLVARGKGNAETAQILSISQKAVEKYLTSIYEKLGIGSRAQLAVYIASATDDTLQRTLATRR